MRGPDLTTCEGKDKASGSATNLYPETGQPFAFGVLNVLQDYNPEFRNTPIAQIYSYLDSYYPTAYPHFS